MPVLACLVSPCKLPLICSLSTDSVQSALLVLYTIMPFTLSHGGTKLRATFKKAGNSKSVRHVDAINTVTAGSLSSSTKASGVNLLWQTAMQRYITRLSTEEQHAITANTSTATLNQQTLESIFEPIRNQYSCSHFYRCLNAVSPIVNHLRSFATVVEVFIQVYPNPASLIWGSVKLLLEVRCIVAYVYAPVYLRSLLTTMQISSQSLQVFNSICEMLTNLSSTLSVFEQ